MTAKPPAPVAVQGRTDRVTVLVVDDDENFCESLAELLSTYELEVLGTAADGQTAVEAVRQLEPDVVLMDVQMPGMNGIAAAAAVLVVKPSTRVVMLTISSDGDDVLDALLAGATGYLVKGTPPEALVAGIRAAAAGDALLSHGIATKLLGRMGRASTDGASADATLVAGALLSERELEVLELLARGKANADIARELYLSPYTVRNHISSILSKLQIANRTEATAYAIRSGLV